MPQGVVLGSGASRYELLEEIGRGGMGVVYRARDKRLEREVALKRLPENLKDHPRVVDLFLREARASAALNHPNIVTIHDVDQEDGAFFITMELLEGIPLNRIVEKRGKLSSFDAARLGIQITTGLGYAHEQRIIHRDIKSANLFFTNEKVVKIMDFGLAKMVEEVRKATTVVGGTPYYMAPEQSAGSGVDHRADLYALGVTLFELVTGKVPFTEGDIPFHHRHTPAPDPREREPERARGDGRPHPQPDGQGAGRTHPDRRRGRQPASGDRRAPSGADPSRRQRRKLLTSPDRGPRPHGPPRPRERRAGAHAEHRWPGCPRHRRGAWRDPRASRASGRSTRAASSAGPS